MKRSIPVLLLTLLFVCGIALAEEYGAVPVIMQGGTAVMGEQLVDMTDPRVTLRFDTEIPGVYTFESTTKDKDTLAFLYNADMQQLATDDDGGADSNFRLTFHIDEDETVYLMVKYYIEDSTDPMPLTVTVVSDENDDTVYQIGDYQYTLNKKGNATLAAYTGRKTVLELPEKLDGHPLKKIGKAAFEGSRITVIDIPASVESIGEGAFMGCAQLTEVFVGAGVAHIAANAFADCPALTYVTLPYSLTAIGDGAFRDDGAIRAVYAAERDDEHPLTIGEENELLTGARWIANGEAPAEDFTWTIHGMQAVVTGYHGRQSRVLVPAYLDDMPVRMVASYAFADCDTLYRLTLPDTVTTIGSAAFCKLTNLESLTLGGGVSTLKGHIVEDCPGLMKIDVSGGNVYFASINNALCTADMKRLVLVPAGLSGEYAVPSVQTIGSYAFKECDKLVRVYLSDGTECLEESAFDHCTNLNYLYISSTVKELEPNFNAGCTKLSYYDVNTTNKFYASYGGMLYSQDGKTLVQYPLGRDDEAFDVPRDVTIIGSHAFAHTNLTRITLPETLNEIGDYAFADTGIEAIDIPGDVTFIGAHAFQDCRQLKEITLPRHMKEITPACFIGCSGLREIVIPTAVIDVAPMAFHGCGSLTSVRYYGTLGTWAAMEIRQFNEPLTDVDWTFLPPEKFETVTLPDGLMIIAEEAFMGKTVEEVVLPASILHIEDRAFADCTCLMYITMPNSLESIADNAFQNCNLVHFVCSRGSLAESYAWEHGIDIVYVK